VLVVDAGSALGGGWTALKSGGEVMVEAMNLMDYDAMALGRMDFALGLPILQERAKDASFPFLAANIVTLAGEPLFEAFTIFERDGVRVGILGLSESEVVRIAGIEDQAKALDFIDAAARYVPELRPQVDLLVVLSHVGLDEDKALAAAVPGIDIIIGGNTRKLMQVPERVGNTLVVQQGYRGEWMGKLDAAFDAEGNIVDAKETLITLGPDYADDPEMAALVAKWAKLYPTPTPRPRPTSTPEKK